MKLGKSQSGWKMTSGTGFEANTSVPRNHIPRLRRLGTTG